MQDLANKTIGELAKNCRTVEDVHEMLKGIFKDTLQQMLEVEISEHLGYEKHSPDGDKSGNSRNGYSKKKVKTKMGPAEIEIPRDRNGEFEPKVVRKYETTTNDLEDKIINMYALGLSTRDIEKNIQDIYGVEISPSFVSKVTDKIMPLINQWQSRPLEPIYPIVFLDAIHFKVRQDSNVVKKAAYTVLGINLSGQKDILGLWIGDNESASFWLTVCNDLKNRGVKDILIACKDGLTGFSEAINAAFPKTELQLCVIHQIRNSLKYVSHKDKKALMADLKKVYQALTIEAAETSFLEFSEAWNEKYPLVIRSWERNWSELTTYFKYPPEIRRIIYTTNMVEGYHRQLRKVTKTKNAYPNDEALRKIIYLANKNITERWTMPIKDWNICISQFVIFFGDRIELELVRD